MMMGPTKKKVITSIVVTAVVLILIFALVAFFYVKKSNEKIAKLEEMGKVEEKYVFARNMLQGDVITSSDIVIANVKGESNPTDSFSKSDLNSIVGRRLKVSANAKTLVTSSLFYEEEKTPSMDTRLQEFNMITLPSDLKVGDYIDIRMRFPTGEDYLVLVGEKVQSFGALNSESNTIFLRLSEEEIIRMSSAIIESYIRDGVYLYANKYVDADAQLFNREYVDFVAKYEKVRYEITSGEVMEAGSGDEVKVVVKEEKRERTVEEISKLINLNVEETENIKIALEEKDEDTLNYYKDKLVTTEKSIRENYPVKKEVASLIKNNPNILQEIKEKYKVEELEQQRVNMLDTALTKLDEYTGELVPNDEYISKINDKLQKEISTQKSERQEYLLKLLAKEK